jgi:hypothetical protein
MESNIVLPEDIIKFQKIKYIPRFSKRIVFLEEPDTNMSAFNYKLVKTLTS